MIKISVVVPVYNASNTIERCVDSIMSNKFDDLEVILIEDCSKDDSLNKCKSLAEKYPQVRCVHNEVNRGVSYTRNRGLDEATGEYIMFVDSDDWVAPNYYALFDNAINQNPDSLIICGYVNHDEMMNGRKDDICYSEKSSDLLKLDLKDEIKNIYDKCLLQQLWNKIFVTKIIKENNIRFDESISIGEDLRLILQYITLSKISSVVFINEPLYHYMRDQKDSLMYKVGTESVEEPLKNLRSLYEIMGYDKDLIEKTIAEDRNKQIGVYAYLILHNAGMKLREKKRLVLALDANNGKELYKKNRNIYFKERLIKLIKK